MAKTKKQRLRDKADRTLQQYVMKDRPNCFVCGKPAYCGHHFINKANSTSLRYYLPNLIPLCQACHNKVHCQPHLIDPVICYRKGEAWYKDLLKEKKKIVRTNLAFYQQVIDKLKC